MIARLPASQGADAVTEALAADGAAIVIDALPSTALAALEDALQPWFARAACGEGPFFGRRTQRFSGLFAKAPPTIALAIQPLALSVAEAALGVGSRCDCIQLNLTQAIAIGPDEPAQLLHRDDDFFPFPRAHEVMVNALWTLDPFTAANGATRIVPGSHLWDRKRRADDDEIIAAEAPAGSIILWLGSTLHGGGANGADLPRRGVVMSYSVGWLAPAEKLLLSIPPEVARGLPPRLQRLIGYQIHRPNLGWVEGQDPLRWLMGETGDLAPAADNLTPDQTARVAAAVAARSS